MRPSYSPKNSDVKILLTCVAGFGVKAGNPKVSPLLGSWDVKRTGEETGPRNEVGEDFIRFGNGASTIKRCPQTSR